MKYRRQTDIHIHCSLIEKQFQKKKILLYFTITKVYSLTKTTKKKQQQQKKIEAKSFKDTDTRTNSQAD